MSTTGETTEEQELIERHRQNLSDQLINSDAIAMALTGYLGRHINETRAIVANPEYRSGLHASLRFEVHAVSADLGDSNVERKTTLVIDHEDGLHLECPVIKYKPLGKEHSPDWLYDIEVSPEQSPHAARLAKALGHTMSWPVLGGLFGDIVETERAARTNWMFIPERVF